jgi:hypothetical protein
VKILVTGSRDWTDSAKIATEIFRCLYEMKTPHSESLLIHGDCPTGADKLADDYARTTGMHIWRFPADWDTHGKRAGFLRNAEMVDLEPDVVLAFIKNGSKGASMTAALAEKKKLETRRFTA